MLSTAKMMTIAMPLVTTVGGAAVVDGAGGIHVAEVGEIVGEDTAPETPLIPEDVVQQIEAGPGPLGADVVLGGHDRHGVAGGGGGSGLVAAQGDHVVHLGDGHIVQEGLSTLVTNRTMEHRHNKTVFHCSKLSK